MKALSILLLLGASLGSFAASAQTERVVSEAATAEQRLAEDIGVDRLSNAVIVPITANGRNVSSLRQSGNLNTTVIDQQSLSTLVNQSYVEQVGTSNSLSVSQLQGGNILNATQTGTRNTLNYTQDGKGNTTNVVQNGYGNRVSGVTDGSSFLLQGDENIMNIKQDGNNNIVKGEVRENRRMYDIKQIGSNHTLTQIESTGAVPVGYSVEMKGQGINLTIQQGKVGY